MTSPLRMAPLDDEDLLDAVQRSFREMILPELERLGADEFVLSQVRSTLSMVAFVRRGLQERLVAQSEAERRLDEILRRDGRAPGMPTSPLELAAEALAVPEVAALLRQRLRVEIGTRTGTEPSP